MMSVNKLLAVDGPFNQWVLNIGGSLDERAGSFWLTFKNGVFLSVQFRDGSYCDVEGLAATEVEIALGREDEGLWLGDDAPLPEQVVGWVPVYDIPAIASAVHDERWATLRYIARGR